MHRSLCDYIASLSDKEKEEHKALIEDCLGRNRQMKENINRIREDLKVLFESWEELQAKTGYLLDSIDRLNSSILDIYLVTRSESFARIVESVSDCYAPSMN